MATTYTANNDFSYGNASFNHMKQYNGDVGWVAAAVAALPGFFFSAAATKTANTSGVFHDSTAGVDRVFRIGEVYPPSDPAVVACPSCFT